MREVERSAASVEEAVEAALEELGITEQEAEVDILRDPGGVAESGPGDAVVRVRPREAGPAADTDPMGWVDPGPTGEGGPESPAEVDQQAQVVPPELDRQADVAADFLEGLFDAMGLPAEVEVEPQGDIVYVDVWGAQPESSMGLLIGKHGQTLDALQDLVRGVVQRQLEERCRVVVDVEDYRKRRRSQLVSRAVAAARRVKRTGRPERLEPMSALERKAVHDAVAQIGGVETSSEGQEPDRRVVIRRGPRHSHTR